MQNEQVFNEYDIVVAIRQKAINDQLHQLVAQGVIKSNLVVYQTVEDQNFHYVTCDSVEQIPQDGSGKPQWAYLSAKLVPQ